MKCPKESLPKPTKDIADKSNGFFQTDKKFFQEAAKDMGMIPNKTGDDIGLSDILHLFSRSS
jgi:dGTPase